MSDDQAPRRASEYRTSRMEAFSDGVFAIAITLLVLEIGVPAGSDDDLLGALGDQWPSYLAYLVSFSTIGAVWITHTVITEYLDHADSALLRFNLLLLLLVRSFRSRRSSLPSTPTNQHPEASRPPSTGSTCCWR